LDALGPAAGAFARLRKTAGLATTACGLALQVAASTSV